MFEIFLKSLRRNIIPYSRDDRYTSNSTSSTGVEYLSNIKTVVYDWKYYYSKELKIQWTGDN